MVKRLLRGFLGVESVSLGAILKLFDKVADGGSRNTR